MRGTVLLSIALVVGTLLIATRSAAQTPAVPGPPPNVRSLENFLPLGPPPGLKPSAVPDLSGAWVADALDRPTPNNAGAAPKPRGQEPDISYQPWALQKMLSEVPPTGPSAQPHRTTDPWTMYCEPNGLVRIYSHPGRTEFVQLPDRVLMLHEVMQQFRIIRLNSTHPPLDDLDPSWWGDSIGWYENGDTLVVDTIGTNGRTWLTQQGHPSTEKLHVIERYRRVNRETLEFEATVDDPGAYTKPFIVRRLLRLSPVPFMQVPWNCSVRDNLEFIDKLLKDAAK